MSKLKKLLCAMFAMVMVLAMSTSASAVTITIDDGDVTGANYSAYQLMSVTNSGTNYSYTVNSKYSSILRTAAGNVTTDAAVIDYLESLNNDSTELTTFAKAVYTAIKADSTLSADYTTNTGSITGADAGYYLIVETATGTITGGASDTYSLYMLDTATGDTATIKTKESVPTLEKKVKETNDSTGSTTDWQDAADYDIGDQVHFQLTGTVSSKYDSYDAYYYAFHDTLSSGLSFDGAASVKVYVDGTLITSGYTVTTTTSDGCSFEVIFNDLKQVSSVTATSKIVVEYTATLNTSAEIGSTGNPNTAKLEYSTNPYNGGDGSNDTGNTPEDKVTVFTYKLDTDKVDSTGAAVNGAGFTLYKWVATGTGSWIAVGSEQKNTTGNTFTWTGLDAGNYKLVETTVPDGYTKADDILFTVTATYDTTSDNPQLTSLTVTVTSGNTSVYGTATADQTSGKIDIDVINKSGSALPTTGGIGTTIFYIVGSILVLGAMVLLITRRRMGKEL